MEYTYLSAKFKEKWQESSLVPNMQSIEKAYSYLDLRVFEELPGFIDI